MNRMAMIARNDDILGKKKTYGLMVGVIYEIFAFLQAIVSSGIIAITFIPAMPIGILVLGILGAVFLYGYWELNQGIEEGVSYIHVGIILSLIFGVIYLLIMGAHSLQAYILGSEDYEDWTISDDLRPELYLSVLTLIGYLLWKDDFSDIRSPASDVSREPIALLSDITNEHPEHSTTVINPDNNIQSDKSGSTGGKSL